MTNAPLVPRIRIRPGVEIEIETSHDGGESWSPTTEVEVAASATGELEVVRVER